MRVFAAAAVALCIALPLQAQQDEIGIALGQVPPAALVQTLDGQTANLSQFVGRRPVLVEFWATWCAICRTLLPRMLEAQRRYGQQVEFVVVGVGVNQSRRSMQRHVEEHPMPFRFFFDATGAAVRAFQAPTTSFIAVLDAQGRVVYTGVGEDQDIDAAVRRALPAAARGGSD